MSVGLSLLPKGEGGDKLKIWNEQIKKTWQIYMMGYYSVIKKKCNLAMCNNMDGPRGYYSE